MIVAEVVECYDHPDSDHLHVTKVNTGAPELLQVVCGAPNVAAGQKVLLATVGTVLGEDFKIKKKSQKVCWMIQQLLLKRMFLINIITSSASRSKPALLSK